MINVNYPKNRYTGVKPWMDKEWLYNEYVVKDRSTQDIADEYGCKRNTIQCWLAKFKIKKKITHRNRKCKYDDEDFFTYDYLYEQYVVNDKSIVQIGKENNISNDTVRRRLEKLGFEIKKKVYRFFDDEETVQNVIKLYRDDKISANQIAKMYNTTHNVVLNTLRRNEVEIRDLSLTQLTLYRNEIPNEYYDAELLRKWHWDENRSCKEIGELLGLDPGVVRRQMNRLGIRTKNSSECKVGLMKGKKHPNWQGGITSLYELIREYSYVNLNPKILARDNYTCQCCGSKEEILHVHHIKHFFDIYNEIINEHPDLDPSIPEDMLQLYDIIVIDDRFTDENNMITLCKDCHLFLIHNYKKRKIISSQDSA